MRNTTDIPLHNNKLKNKHFLMKFYTQVKILSNKYFAHIAHLLEEFLKNKIKIKLKVVKNGKSYFDRKNKKIVISLQSVKEDHTSYEFLSVDKIVILQLSHEISHALCKSPKNINKIEFESMLKRNLYEATYLNFIKYVTIRAFREAFSMCGMKYVADHFGMTEDFLKLMEIKEMEERSILNEIKHA